FSDPSVAERVPSRTGMWGKWMLRLNNIAKPQTILSEAIPIPQKGVEYAAAVTPKGPWGATVSLSVIDAETKAVLGSASSRDINRGFSAVVRFAPGKTNVVRLQIEAAPPKDKTATIDLDYASLARSRDYGVVASPSTWYFPQHLQVPAIGQPARQARNFTIKN